MIEEGRVDGRIRREEKRSLSFLSIDHFTVPFAILKDNQAFASKRRWS
jgi:hypothetical protein